VEQAAQCDRTSGLIGLNGISFTGSQDRGPWLGRTAAILTRHSPTDEWSIDPDNLSWFEIQYSDDVWTGDAYTYNDGASTVRTVGGDQKIRHLFTVHDADRHVDGVWLRAGRASQLDAGAQYSTDGGEDWSAFTGTYHPDRDLSLLFTIVGMPRFLPDELSQTSIRTQSWGQIKAEIR